MNPNFNPFQNNFNFNLNQALNNFNPNMIGINNNNFINQNFMNNQYQMMQMNQMMMQNMNNQINNNILNQNHNINNIQNNNNFNFKNQNQKILVDKIIEFYRKNGRKFMNYNEPNQIKKLLDNLDTNNPNLKEGIILDDPMSYIKEKKKLIKFINHDFKIFNVKVPISIDKNTLYQVAEKYKILYYSKTLLIYKNSILNNDESSIEIITDNDYVIIIENIYYLDNSYFNSLNKINIFTGVKNVKIEIDSHLKNFVVPNGTKFSELFKALMFYLGGNYFFYYNGESFDGENILKDSEVPFDSITIKCFRPLLQFRDEIFGKKIFLTIKYINLNKNLFKYNFGILNSIKHVISRVEIQEEVKVEKIYLEGKEINFEEDRSLASFGINKDCTLSVLIKNK